MIYWIEGNYIKEAVKQINYFMRDWRTDQVKPIDLRTVDIMAAAHNLLDTNEPYMLLSGYRSPKTNAMLRSRSRGVAKNSLHMKGQAADLRISNRSYHKCSGPQQHVAVVASVAIRDQTLYIWTVGRSALGDARRQYKSLTFSIWRGVTMSKSSASVNAS